MDLVFVRTSHCNHRPLLTFKEKNTLSFIPFNFIVALCSGNFFSPDSILSQNNLELFIETGTWLIKTKLYFD